ncbi:MAG: peptidase S1 [Oceanicaulis sp.]
MKTMLLGGAVALLAFAGAASAQDVTLEPNFGAYELEAGFTPDPATLDIVAGGSVDAASVGCAGSISQAPDVRLMWSGGQITIGAESTTDTTLVINAPNGQWFCADDTNGFNPAITLSGSGQYDIWVGVYGGGTAEASLYATEY